MKGTSLEKNVKMSPRDKIWSVINNKCSILGGVRKPVVFDFTLKNSDGYRAFSKPETTHYNKKKLICFEK